MSKYVLTFSLLFFISCNHNKPNENNIIEKSDSLSLFDTIKNSCPINSIDTFDMRTLQTDSFDKMFLINKSLYNRLYAGENNYSEKSFFIYSYLPHVTKNMSLITYQKNFEGNNYRVDYIDLICIDSVGNQLDKIRLAALDNNVIDYEVNSVLNDNKIRITEKISTEPFFDPNFDTLYTLKTTLLINSDNRIDSLTFTSNYEIRKY